MALDFYDIIHAVIIFQLTVLITVLLLKGWNDVSNRILAFFLFAQMMASVNAIWWNHADFFLSTHPWISHLSEPFILCWGPAMFLYVLSRNSQNFKLKTTHLLHFLPALIMAIYLFFIFQRFSNAQKTEIIQAGSLHPKFLFANLYILVIVQVAIYNIAATIYQEKRLKNELLKNELGIEKIKWNRFILYGYFFTCIIYDISLMTVPKVLSWESIKYLSFLFFAAYFTAILYKAIVSNIFSKETPTKAKRALLLPENELQKIVCKTESLMANEKPYLDFDFGLKELAVKIEVADRLLSQAINECRKQNINDFINGYRVEEAKKIISQNGDPKKTFLEIAYESGFNSKSSFYLAFKKNTGLTPTEFKSQHSEK